MSKTKLLKELRNYSADQLIELIGEVYDAKIVSARDYFEYFLNPDENKLLEKIENDIRKEICRTKWSIAKFRVSLLRKQLALLEVYGVSFKMRAAMIIFTIDCCLGISEGYMLSETQKNFVAETLQKLMEYLDRNGELINYIPVLKKLVAETHESYSNRGFLSSLNEVINNYDPMSTAIKRR